MTLPVNTVSVLSVEQLDARLVAALSGSSPAAVRIQSIVAAALAGGTAGQALKSIAAGAVRSVGLLPSIIQRKGSYKNLITNPRGKTTAPAIVRTNRALGTASGYFGATVTTDNANQYFGRDSFKTITNSATNPQGIVGYASLGATLATGTVIAYRFAIKASKSVAVNYGARNVGATAGAFEQSVALTATTVWQEVTGSYTVLTAVTGGGADQGIQVALNTAESGVTIWVSRAVIEINPGTTPIGSYFDGATAASGLASYAWTGTANASTSTMTDGQPTGWTPTGGALVSVVTDGIQVAPDTAQGRGVTGAISGLTTALTYTAAVRLRALTAASTLRMVIGGQTVNSASVAAGSEVTLYATWTQSGTTASLVLTKTAGTGGFIVTGTALVAGLYDGPPFDGSTGPAVWDGAAHASTSTTFPGSLSVWDGTAEAWVNDSLSGLPKVDPVTGALNVPSLTIEQTPTLPSHGVRKDYADAIKQYADGLDSARGITSDGRFGIYLGTGASFPASGMKVSDTFLHTQRGLCVWDGSTWLLLNTYQGKLWRTAGFSTVLTAAQIAFNDFNTGRLSPGFTGEYTSGAAGLVLPSGLDGFYEVAFRGYISGNVCESGTAMVRRRAAVADLDLFTLIQPKPSSSDNIAHTRDTVPLKGGDKLLLRTTMISGSSAYYGTTEAFGIMLSARYVGPLNGTTPL